MGGGLARRKAASLVLRMPRSRAKALMWAIESQTGVGEPGLYLWRGDTAIGLRIAWRRPAARAGRRGRADAGVHPRYRPRTMGASKVCGRPVPADWVRSRAALPGEQVFGLEHRTLSESPSTMLQLQPLRRCWSGARVSSVSHSARRLVGTWCTSAR